MLRTFFAAMGGSLLCIAPALVGAAPQAPGPLERALRASEQSAEEWHLRPSQRANDAPPKTELLAQRRCQPGYGYCSNSGICCPVGSACTNDGHCVPQGVNYCGGGRYCSGGSLCMRDGGCAPPGVNYCGGGRYCQSGSICLREGGCLARTSERVCSNGSYCDSGHMCMNDGRCLSTSSPRYCGGGHYCNEGSVCNGSGGCRSLNASNDVASPPPVPVGAGPSGGGSPSAAGNRGACNWNSAVQYARIVNQRRGTRCGTPDSYEMDIQNASNQPLKIVVYLLDNQGRWQKMADGTFDDGIAPGHKINQYTCHSGGKYKVIAMTAAEFRANRCSYPDYHGY